MWPEMLVAPHISAAARAVPPPRPRHRPASPQLRTHEGGPAFVREPREELFLLAVGNFVSQQTFYESGEERDDRYTRLVGELAVQDPAWTAGLLRWLRGEGNMRTASLVGAAAYVRARLAAGATGGPANRSVIDSVLQRADEPGELLAHWVSAYGRKVPQPVKRGIADAVRRLYTSRSLLKYDTPSKNFPLRRRAQPGARLSRSGQALAGRALPVRPGPPIPPGASGSAAVRPPADRPPGADGVRPARAAGDGDRAGRLRTAGRRGHDVGVPGGMAARTDGRGRLGSRDPHDGADGAPAESAELRRGGDLGRGRGPGGRPAVGRHRGRPLPAVPPSATSPPTGTRRRSAGRSRWSGRWPTPWPTYRPCPAGR